MTGSQSCIFAWSNFYSHFHFTVKGREFAAASRSSMSDVHTRSLSHHSSRRNKRWNGSANWPHRTSFETSLGAVRHSAGLSNSDEVRHRHHSLPHCMIWGDYLDIYCRLVNSLILSYVCCRGYFPRGGGEVKVQTSPVRQLRAVDLTSFGTIKRITGRAFVAGVIPFKVSWLTNVELRQWFIVSLLSSPTWACSWQIAQQMAKSATSVLWRSYREVPINIQAVQEPKNAVVGNGTGIIVVAETTTGVIRAHINNCVVCMNTRLLAVTLSHSERKN